MREKFKLKLQDGKLILSGDLVDSSQVLALCRKVFKKVSKSAHLVVQAENASITPEGETTWLKVVEEFLMGCHLTYAPSQLGLICQHDERYKHPASQFQED